VRRRARQELQRSPLEHDADAADHAAHTQRGPWWEYLRHDATALLTETETAERDSRADPGEAPISFVKLSRRLNRALWLADHRPNGLEWARQWWGQGDALSALSAVHAADEELTTVRLRSDLLARAPLLRADLARLLAQDDPRRRDVLRVLDRVVDEANEPRSVEGRAASREGQGAEQREVSRVTRVTDPDQE